LAKDRAAARARILPALGDVELAKLTTKRIRDWHTGLATAPKLVRTSRIVKKAQKRRQADRGETALATQARLVDQNAIDGRGAIRDLALFNLAVDSKLRGCDVVAVKVEDVAPNGYAMDRATVRQKKTGRPVKFELTDQTR
jgi:integrase